MFGKLISKSCVPHLPISDRPTIGFPLLTLPKPPTAEEIDTAHSLFLMKEQHDPGDEFLHDANLESTLPLLESKLSTPISEHDLGIEHLPNLTGEGSVLEDAMEKVVGRKDVSVSFTSDGKFIDAFVSILEDYEDAMDKIICGNDTEFDCTNW